MKRAAQLLTLLLILSFSISVSQASHVEVCGNVSGTWDADTVNVLCDITIPPNATLAINDGTVILFQAYFRFSVSSGAVLRAMGRDSSLIMFNERFAGNGWHGIHFVNCSDSSRLDYCMLKHDNSYGEGMLVFPTAIAYGDSGDEMQICEQWGDSSGIQSYEITRGNSKIESGQLPFAFQLHQNYPNPFNSTTMIMFDLDKAGITNLIIYNILGQRVRILVNADLAVGRHNIAWDGHNQSGDVVSSGVYFYALSQGEKNDVKKLLLLK